MKKKARIILIVLICIVAIIAGGTGYLAGSTYKAENPIFTDNETTITTQSNITVNKLSDGNIEFVPETASSGLIFYPGGNVEYTAYAPLLERLAEKGFLCILIKMPLNLAIFDEDAADGIAQKYPEVSSWYIGGHSLGGAMAGAYFSKNSQDLDGLVLLAAYSTADISYTDKTVISIYGSNDGVLNREKYNEYKTNLPDNYRELVIDGGCHSYFGDYGNQKGDGTPTITREQQLDATVDFITE